MGSQFVDLDADGHLDYLTATFDGSPHVAYGSPEGFAEPVRLKDKDGERIIIAYIWNYDTRKHETLGRALGTGDPPKERCISALAFDWDGDGDHDLLLGSYEEGHLYRQMNEGSDAEPKFTGKNIPVMAGSTAWALPTKMTAPRLVDWDGDGDLDLIAGSFGDSSLPTGDGGGVYLSRNEGAPGEPKFGALEALIPPIKKGGNEPTKPDTGLYADAVDYDGDGDLDLVVGGSSFWIPEQRELSGEEEETLAGLREEQQKFAAAHSEVMQKVNAEITEATAGLERSEQAEKRTAVYTKHRDAISEASQKVQAVRQKIEELVPGPKRKTFVWLYERQ